MFIVTECTEKDAKEICTWKYEGEYAVYNYSSWEVVCANGWDLADDIKRKDSYVSVYMDGRLFGFYNIMNRDDHVELGVGMKPDMCGKHFGVEFMRLAMSVTEERYPGLPIILKVRPFNKRAIKCYENCGFEIKSKYYEDKFITPGEMYIMERR